MSIKLNIVIVGAERRICASGQRRARARDPQRCGADDLAAGLRAQGQAAHAHGAEEQPHAGDGAAGAPSAGDRAPAARQH